MKLFYREFGAGESLIILHGLFGMSDNWLTIGKKLGEKYRIWIPDLRNHGRSPHSVEHDYNLMVEDLLEFIHDHQISNPIIMGHSMGGKVAMQFTYYNTELVRGLIVVDIAPSSGRNNNTYPPGNTDHREILNSMKSLDLSILNSRNDAELQMAKKITSVRTRLFILKNLHRSHDGSFHWLCNVDVLYNSLNVIMQDIELSKDEKKSNPVKTPSLFIKGELSDYISNSDKEQIHFYFPMAEIREVRSAGHWVHADQPEIFTNLILDFLKNNSENSFNF